LQLPLGLTEVVAVKKLKDGVVDYDNAKTVSEGF